MADAVDIVEKMCGGLYITDQSEKMRSRAYQVCRDYLLGAWKQINQDSMVMRQISGGLSNHLYYCALPPSHKPVASEPKEVLLRIYGQMHGEDALENMLAESVIFTLLSERKLGPRLYGVFPGGRLEQYIQARSLKREELRDPELSRQIACKVARVHSLNVPISKEASWLWTSIHKWLTSSDELMQESSKEKSMVDKLRSFDARAEVEYVHRLINQLESPVVFAHNDLQEGNILLQKTKTSRKVALIDFEYCAYNYRSFDLANHFSERVYGYKLTIPPYFTVHTEDYPTREEQLAFIRTYLSEYKEVRDEAELPQQSENPKKRMSSRLNEWYSEALSPEEQMLKEVQVFNLAGHLFWILWSIVQGHVSTITFGYLEYAKIRMEHYMEQKANLEKEIEAVNRRYM